LTGSQSNQGTKLTIERHLVDFAVPHHGDRLLAALQRARLAVRSDQLTQCAASPRLPPDIVSALHIVGACTAPTKAQILSSPRTAVWLKAVRALAEGDQACLAASRLGCSLAVDALQMDERVGESDVAVDHQGRICLLTGHTALDLGPEYARRHVTLRAENGRITITSRGAQVELLRTIQAIRGRSGGPPVCWFDDLVDARVVVHPRHELGDQEIAEWAALLDGGRDCLASVGGPWSRLVDALVDRVVPMLRPATDRRVSGTNSVAPGAVAASAPPTAALLAETLVHEQQHVRLDLLLTVYDVVRSNNVRLRSPWRADLRPPTGLLHGAFAFVGVANFWSLMAVRGATSSGEGEAEAEKRAREVHTAISLLRRSGTLTSLGEIVASSIHEAAQVILNR
jgi:HEXXH motif-containing protein